MPGVPQGRPWFDDGAGDCGGVLLGTGAPASPPDIGGGALEPAAVPALPAAIPPPRCASAVAIFAVNAAAIATDKTTRRDGELKMPMVLCSAGSLLRFFVQWANAAD
jgi:hypothetical protein